VDTRRKDALKEMDMSCININIPPQVLFLFLNRLFYCVQPDAATGSGEDFMESIFLYHEIAGSNPEFIFINNLIMTMRTQ
jgi:hypothetical protein